MAKPLGLEVKTNLNDMQIGDCIPCRYTATNGVAGNFSELGTCDSSEIPTAGTATPDGLFYFIKVDKGTLIADRVVQTNISWNVLNNAKYIEGNDFCQSIIPILTSDSVNGYIVTSSSIYSAGWEGWKAFNNVTDNNSDSWISNTTTGTLGIQLPDKKSINSYSLIQCRDDTSSPRNWTFEGSNDGIIWTLLDTQTNQEEKKVRNYRLANDVKYSRYRINITANNGQVYVSIGELKLYKKLDNYSIRSLSGGCAYADSNGNSSLTDKSLGAWPVNNEWDKYIVNSDLDSKIVKGDNNIWNILLGTWTKDTPILLYGSYNSRVYRGKNADFTKFDNAASTTTVTSGFRPVLNYIESDIASEVIY